MDATPPPLGVKLTGYRLSFMTIVFSFGAAKSILAYKGQSIAPTILDWVSGTFLTILLYWIGLYENSDQWKWFFQVDLAPAIGYFAMRTVGGALWLPLLYSGKFVLLSLLFSVNWIILHERACRFPRSPLRAWLAVCFVISTWALLLWSGLGLIIGRVRVLRSGWMRVISFLVMYGPGAPRAERPRWFGMAGTMVGIFCGIALLLLPLALGYFYFIGFRSCRRVLS